jgi:signal transduction histidine kinase
MPVAMLRDGVPGCIDVLGAFGLAGRTAPPTPGVPGAGAGDVSVDGDDGSLDCAATGPAHRAAATASADSVALEVLFTADPFGWNQRGLLAWQSECRAPPAGTPLAVGWPMNSGAASLRPSATAPRRSAGRAFGAWLKRAKRPPPSVSLSSRLLLLVMSWALPAVAAGAAIIYLTARAERAADEQTLRETTRALAFVVDREFERRIALGRALATQVEQTLPSTPASQAMFIATARAAMNGAGGWAELRLDGQPIVSTRISTRISTHAAGRSAARTLPASDKPVAADVVSPLQLDEQGMHYTTLATPVRQGGRDIGSVAVTMVAAEFQALMDTANVPADWFASIVDSDHRIAARHPGGARYLGHAVAPTLSEPLQRSRFGSVDGTTLDGHAVTGYFHTLPGGWTFAAGMPTPEFGGYLARTVVQVTLGGLVLLLLAVAGAVWVARSIAAPVLLLERAALRLQNGQPVPEAQATGITECDHVAQALTRASEHVLGARQRMEQQVAQAVERTREAEQAVARSQRIEALGRLTGGVAHDFNNLLGIVSNSARLVQRQGQTLPALNVPVNAMLRAVDGGQRLTQHLLGFAGRRPVQPRAVSLDPYLPEMTELLRSVVGQRVELLIGVAGGTPAVTVDTSELELALINLCLNARDAMPDGGSLTVEARPAELSECVGLPDDRYVAIIVSDTGTGMDAALAERAFEPFFTTKPASHGTGLGLSQVHGFCVQAGGAARLETASGRGMRVLMLLPATAREVQSAPVADNPAYASTQSHAHGLRVLLVEDNASLAQVTEALLASHGAQVVTVSAAAQALDHLRRCTHKFDVVLSDVIMPGPMDGIGLARALHRSHPQLPIVLVSGYSGAHSNVREFTVLRKPVGEQDLIDALRVAVTGVASP